MAAVLISLPAELLIKIMTHLTEPEKFSLAQTCSKVKGIAIDEMQRSNLKGSRSSVYFACTKGDIDYMKRALDAGVPINTVFTIQEMRRFRFFNNPSYHCGEHPITPLTVAISWQHADLVEMLLDRGASVTQADPWYFAPYLETGDDAEMGEELWLPIWALTRGILWFCRRHARTVRLDNWTRIPRILLAHGADIDKVNDDPTFFWGSFLERTIDFTQGHPAQSILKKILIDHGATKKIPEIAPVVMPEEGPDDEWFGK